MSLHILIPCKSLAAGKSRLAPVLDAPARQALCTRFLDDTLALALALAPPGRCHLVSADPEAAARAVRRGVTMVADPGQGLNAALTAGRDAIVKAPGEALTLLLVLPIDLPFATADVLAAFGDLRADVTIAPDRGRSGTNALGLGARAAKEFTFRFGPGSFAAHQEAARLGGWRAAIFADPRLAFDLDQPEDYREWQHETKARRAAAP
jgi:2-phospho-L-lactate guanylyltransferase